MLFGGENGAENLRPLQKTVCNVLFAELQQETSAMQARRATGSQANVDDRFCFELTSLVLTLSGTPAGLKHLSTLPGTLATCVNLLQIGTGRLQRTAVVIVRRAILQSMTPDACDRMLRPRIQLIRASGFSGFLFALIASSFSINLRVPGQAPSMMTLGNVDGLRLDATIDWEIAKELLQLLANVPAVWRDKFNEKCLAALDELTRSWSEGGATNGTDAPLWWAVAALCVISDEVVDSKQPPPPRLPGSEAKCCSNHDDGVTMGVVSCKECDAHFCAQCDLVLHLPQAKRGHRRAVLEAQQMTRTITVKEGTARLKTQYGVLAVDRRNGKAVCELKQQVSTESAGAHCRFCFGLLADAAVDVHGVGGHCDGETCGARAQAACTKLHLCGHNCGGIRAEETCLPCLHCDEGLFADADDFCNICWAENLSSAPAIKLGCGHIFHAECMQTMVDRRWPGPAVAFSCVECPICKAELSHPAIAGVAVILSMKAEIQRKAEMRLKFENKDKDPEVVDPNSKWFSNPVGFAMDKYNYYQCHSCEKPYFGGERQCGVAAGDSFDPAELICPGCAAGDAAQICPKHGTDYLEYKCRYCCSVAVWFCFGTTHFCEPCHNDNGRMVQMQQQATLPKCPCGPCGKALAPDAECPIGGQHPPTGEEYSLGCGVCRGVSEF